MKKIMIVGILVSTLMYGGKLDIVKLTNKFNYSSAKDIGKLTKQIHKSPYARRMLAAKFIKSNVADGAVMKVCKMQPQYCVLAKSSLVIARKSKYADELMATTDYPLDVIRFHMRHGDTFLDTMKGFSVGVGKTTSAQLQLLKRKFPNMPQINTLAIKDFNDKMIITLRRTGKKGWEATQELMALAKKYPKSTAVAGLMAWYVTDPESFLEQKDKLIVHIGATVKEGVSDVTKVGLGVSSGVADGFMDVAKEKMTISNLLVLLLAFVAFVLWKLRSYISRYFHIKLENGLVNAKKNNKQKLNNKDDDDEEGLL